MMDRRVLVTVSVLAATGVAGACHKAPPPAAPTPVSVDTAALRRAREDSLRAAQEAEARRRAAEEQARAQAAAQALERARAALTAPIYFDFDVSTISDEARSTLDQKVALLRANPDLKLRIEGNADERGSEEYNLALGMRRAQAARDYITGFGIDAARLAMLSNGEDKPADPGHDESAWAKNRRDEFVITSGGERITSPAAR
jgi:peptidoglycan-associated lipoprotein